MAAILLPASGQIATGLNRGRCAGDQDQVEAALTQLDPLVVRDPSDRPLRRRVLPAGGESRHSCGAWRTAHAVRRERPTSPCRGSDAGVQGAAHPLRPAPSSPCCCGSALAGRSGGWKGAVPGELRPLANSKWLVPLSIGLVAMAAAVIARIFRRQVGPAAVSRSEDGRPIRQKRDPGDDEDGVHPSRRERLHATRAGAATDTTPIPQRREARSTAPAGDSRGGGDIAPSQVGGRRVMPQPGQAIPVIRAKGQTVTPSSWAGPGE